VERYLLAATHKLQKQHSKQIVEAAYQDMVTAGEFRLLDQYGDSLEKPPQE
jgi:hypothetical protein